jgi:hypothetical protein
VAVEVRVDVEELAAELDLGDVLQVQDVAVGGGPEDDVLVLLGRVEAALVDEHVLERLRGLAGGLADAAGGADDALLADRVHHVLGRDVVGPHPVGVEPDAHGVLPAAEDAGLPDALDAHELGQDVDVGEVEQELLVGVLGGAVEVDVHQHAGLTREDDALELDQLRELAHHLVDPRLDVDDAWLGSVSRSKMTWIVASPALVASEIM